MWSMHKALHPERKIDDSKDDPSLQNQKPQNGYREEEIEHYISVIRNGVSFYGMLKF